MNTPDNQTPAKLSISEIVAGIKELAGFTSDFIKVSSDTFATEFPFDFVSDGALKINLCNTCRRMMLVKLGFFGTEEGSFDEFSRNIHILFEGLVNVWLKQHYFSNTLIIDFVKNYTAIKTENFFRNYAPANRPKVDIYTRFQNEIIANSLLLEQFYDDYSKNDSCLDTKYALVFEKIGAEISLFKTRVTPKKIDVSRGVERIGFPFKMEFLFLTKVSTSSIYTFSSINRLNEYRNSISHPTSRVDVNSDYYKQLVQKTDKIQVLFKELLRFYEFVRLDLSPLT